MKSGLIISTRAQLYLGAGTILTCVIIVILAGLTGTSKISGINQQIAQAQTITNQITELKADQNMSHTLLLEYVLASDAITRTGLEELIRHQSKEITTQYSPLENSLLIFPDAQEHYVTISPLLREYRQNRERQITLVRDGEQVQAINLTNEVQNLLYDKIRAEMDLILMAMKTEIKTLEDSSAEVFRMARTFIWIPGIVSLIVVLLMVAWAIWVIRSLTREIMQGIGILDNTANEILTTATAVSTAATETATSVAETTTTIEEVRHTSQLANQKATKVLENAQRASDVAENGKDAVMKTIDGMQKIKSQMDLIAESIVRLADQSRVIGDITTTVNDLADQSNLLAVNASIEAARAGEQGRGFAVVAQEIRSLSEQSKKSTAHIKEILNDIQKSVSHTVMATEQGSKAVESGSLLANESGNVIELLAETVEEAAQSALQISSSTHEQMAGMDQIVPAMENIKHASEQNVIGTRQTQVVARQLSLLGKNLSEAIQKFNV